LGEKKQTNKTSKKQTTKNYRKSKQDLSKYDFVDEENNDEEEEERSAKKRKKESDKDKLNTTANSSNATSYYESCTENETDELRSKAKKRPR